MVERSKYYGELGYRDAYKAISEVSTEILEVQDHLRQLRPESPLLPLITVDAPSETIFFGKGFGDYISQQTGAARSRLGNWFSGLGHYIDLMETQAREAA